MSQPSLPAAVFFTVTAPVALAEMVFTALYIPYAPLTYALAGAAAFLAICAGIEWNDLHNHRYAHPPRPARTHRRAKPSTPRNNHMIVNLVAFLSTAALAYTVGRTRPGNRILDWAQDIADRDVRAWPYYLTPPVFLVAIIWLWIAHPYRTLTNTRSWQTTPENR